ncbi:MAG: hypothetical protein PHY59_06785 [Methanobacterium sp.]|nr:hypothetical protein [Methanobacterium sp.]
MKKQTTKIVLYITGLSLIVSGILGFILPQLDLTPFTSVVWIVLGIVFLAIGYGTKIRKVVLYAAGIFLFIAGILGMEFSQLGISTLNSVLWAILGILFMYISYSVKY